MLTPSGQTYDRNLDEPTLFAHPNQSFKQAAVGKDHCAMLTVEGKVMTMGSMDHGKLGHEPKVKEKLSNMAKQMRNAKDNHASAQIGFIHGELAAKKVLQVACGFQHTVALTEDGEVYSWGQGKFGALGHGNNVDQATPNKVAELKDIVKIDCGSEYTMALDKEG